MSEIFKTHLDKFIKINEDEFSGILSFFDVIHVRKKENILEKGQICKFHYFVLNGCIRKFFINEKGVERTTEFAIENWWITDHIAYEHQLPSEFFIQAVEHSEILMLNKSSQEMLFQKFPVMERYFRFIYQRAYASSQMRIKFLYDYSREELYHQFHAKHPEFIRRIPQHLIASYLGFTPEYLSQIRGKIRS